MLVTFVALAVLFENVGICKCQMSVDISRTAVKLDLSDVSSNNSKLVEEAVNKVVGMTIFHKLRLTIARQAQSMNVLERRVDRMEILNRKLRRLVDRRRTIESHDSEPGENTTASGETLKPTKWYQHFIKYSQKTRDLYDGTSSNENQSVSENFASDTVFLNGDDLGVAIGELLSSVNVSAQNKESIARGTHVNPSWLDKKLENITTFMRSISQWRNIQTALVKKIDRELYRNTMAISTLKDKINMSRQGSTDHTEQSFDNDNVQSLVSKINSLQEEWERLRFTQAIQNATIHELSDHIVRIEDTQEYVKRVAESALSTNRQTAFRTFRADGHLTARMAEISEAVNEIKVRLLSLERERNSSSRVM